MNPIHILLGVVCGLSLAAAAMGDTQKQCAFKKTVTKTVQGGYLLYLPQDYGRDADARWPLVVFLHGAGERGSDLEKVKLIGPPQMVAAGRQFPFMLVSPQCPENSWWNDETEMLLTLIDEIEAKYRVDKNRILLTGISMGGYGTWVMAMKEPKRFAAIAPICGAGNHYMASVLKDVPMWVFHGDKDDVVPPERSQEMVDAVKAAGGNPKFTLYPGVGHDSWAPAYKSEEFWKWFLEQRKK